MYASYKEAFGAGEIDELDKMAQAMNNTVKDKSTVLKAVEHPSKIPDITQVTSGQQFKYFSTQGNLTSDVNESNYYKYLGQGIPIQRPLKQPITNESYEEPKMVEKPEYQTLLNELARKDVEVQKNKQRNNEYQDKINTLIDILRDHHNTDMTSGDSLDNKLEHIKVCKACREEFVKLLNNKNHVFEQTKCSKPSKPYPIASQPVPVKVVHATQNPEKPSESLIEGFGKLIENTNTKDIVIGILIGVIILLLLDTIQKPKRN